MKENRFVSRNKVWPETEAVIKYQSDAFSNLHSVKTLTEKINNLSSKGMFLETAEDLGIDTELDIEINFNPGKKPEISLKAEGVVTRSESDGVAVLFTKINTQALGDCIMQKLNS